MLKRLANLITPFSIIAKELTIIRELYEADLDNRKIYRVTEKPGKSDTEITFVGEDEEKPKGSALQRLAMGLLGEEEEQDDEND